MTLPPVPGPPIDTATIRDWTHTGHWPQGTDVDETLAALCDLVDHQAGEIERLTGEVAELDETIDHWAKLVVEWQKRANDAETELGRQIEGREVERRMLHNISGAMATAWDEGYDAAESWNHAWRKPNPYRGPSGGVTTKEGT